MPTPPPHKDNQQWRRICRLALSEPDKRKLLRLISEARIAVDARVEQVFKIPWSQEHRDLNQALQALQALEHNLKRNNS